MLSHRSRVWCLSRSLQGSISRLLDSHRDPVRSEQEAASPHKFSPNNLLHTPAMASAFANTRGAPLLSSARAAHFKPISAAVEATRPSGDDSLFGKSSNLVSAQSKCVASDTLKSDGQCLPPGGAASLIQVNPSSTGASRFPIPSREVQSIKTLRTNCCTYYDHLES